MEDRAIEDWREGQENLPRPGNLGKWGNISNIGNPLCKDVEILVNFFFSFYAEYLGTPTKRQAEHFTLGIQQWANQMLLPLRNPQSMEEG